MTPDSIKTLMTYLLALVIVIGGGLLLVIPSQVPSEQLLPFLTGIVGAVIGFVFSERSGASGAASQRSVTITDEPAHQQPPADDPQDPTL